MGIGFLAPLLLAAFAAVALPIWLHLTHREKKEVVQFPSLMFLQQLPNRAARKRRIRHPLLLSLRALALLLIIAAFARPVFERANAASLGGSDPAETRIILLDRSLSMGYGSQWEEALEAARALIRELGADDEAALLFFADDVTLAVPPTSDRARLVQALDTVTPGVRGTRYGPVLQAAASLLEDANRPRRTAHLISDFQKGAWRGDDGIRFPSEAELIPVPIGADLRPNLTLTGVDVERAMEGGISRITLIPRIANHGDESVDGFPVIVEVGGREVVRGTVEEIPPRGVGRGVVPPFTLTERWSQVTVRIADDGLQGDNVAHLVLSPESGIPVLVIDGSGREAGALYVTRALEIGEDPKFQVQVKRPDAFRAEDLPGRQLVIFHEALPPAEGALGARLTEWVERGGGLLVAPGEAQGTLSPLLPVTFSGAEDRRGVRGGTLGFAAYDHPILEPFARPGTGDLLAARFYRTRPLDPAPGSTVLARFDDGAAALVANLRGQGRVLIWGATLDTRWTDLPVQPVFLPLMRQMGTWLTNHRSDPESWTVGSVAELRGSDALGDDGQGGARGDRVAVLAQGGSPIPLEVREGVALLPLETPGFVSIRGAGDRTGGGYTLAVNVDPEEGDLTRLDPAELAASVQPREGEIVRASPVEGPSREDRERRQSLWWYLLVVALLLLGAEAVLGNRLSRQASY
jgi:hypothetical protein